MAAAPIRESASRRCAPPRLHNRSGPAPRRRTTAPQLSLYLDLQHCMTTQYPQFGLWTTLTAKEAMHVVSDSKSSCTTTVRGIRRHRVAIQCRHCFTDIIQRCCGHVFPDLRRQGSSRDHIDGDFNSSVNLASSRYHSSELNYSRPTNESRWSGPNNTFTTSSGSSIRPAA